MTDINRHALRKARDIMVRHGQTGLWFEGERLSPDTVALMSYVEQVDAAACHAFEALNREGLGSGSAADRLRPFMLPTTCEHAPIRDQDGWRCQDCGAKMMFMAVATPPTGAASSVASDCKIMVPRDPMLIRCMGGHRCTHVPGTCTATARHDV